MSRMRIGGLASGMDTDMMVQSLMRVERMKVDRFEQSKQWTLWRQESYNNINRTFANFILNTKREMGLTKIGASGISTGVSLSKLDYVKMATASDASKANVSVTADAVNGSFELDIESLATGGIIASGELKDSDVVNGMKFKIQGEKDGPSHEITVNGSTMQDVVKAINAKKDDTKVTAFYDKENKKLFLQSTETGNKSEISLSKVTTGEGGVAGGDFLDKLRDKNSGFTRTVGKDAVVKFNGVNLNYSSNRFTLNGVNIELKDVGKTTIKVDTNVEGIMDKVKKLVADYNELIDKVSGLVNEKRYPSFHPLSQEEKKAMHESDVKLWEEKARSGLLSNDETLNKVLQDIRNELYKTVEGNGELKSIIDLGITTERYARGAAGGKLQIDEDKLRKAIEKDPEGVLGVLFKEDEYKGTDNKSTKNGIFTNVYDRIIDGMKSIIDKSGPGEDRDLFRNVKSNILLDFVTKKSNISDMDKEIRNMDRRIDDMNMALMKKEDAHYAKFAAMEKMLQKMYSQSNWIGQQMMM